MSSRFPDHLRDPTALAAFCRRLTRYANVCLGRSFADGEDLAQEALTRALSADGPEWDTLKEPDFFRFVAGIVDGFAGNERWKTRHRPDGAVVQAALATEPLPSPEDATGHVEERSVILRKLRERCELPRDADVLELAALIAEGMDSRIEQAKALGCGMNAIVLLRRRLIRKLKDVRRELEDVREDVRHG